MKRVPVEDLYANMTNSIKLASAMSSTLHRQNGHSDGSNRNLTFWPFFRITLALTKRRTGGLAFYHRQVAPEEVRPPNSLEALNGWVHDIERFVRRENLIKRRSLSSRGMYNNSEEFGLVLKRA